MRDKPRILYVDDEEGNLTAFKYQFEEWYKVYTCSSGAEALRLIENNQIQVIISDQRMPGMTGTELLAKTRAIHPEMVRIILTGFSDIEAVIDALNKSQVYHYFQKPWDETALRVTIDNAIEAVDLEARVRKAEEQFHSTFEQAAVGLTHASLEGRFLIANQVFRNLVGYSEEELLGLTVSDITLPGDLTSDSLQIREVAAGSRPYALAEKRLVRKNGSPVWVKVTVSAGRSKDHEITHLIAVVEDIGAVKNAEEASKTSQRLLEEAQSIAHVGHWSLNLVSNTLDWSDEVYRIFGLEPRQFGATLKAFAETVHPDDRDRVLAAYSAHVEQDTEYDIVHRVVRPDGEIRHVRELCRTERDEAGKPMLSVGTVQDITELAMAEKQLREERNLAERTLNSLPGVFYLFDVEGTVVRWNDNMERVTGYSGEEISQMRAVDFVDEGEQTKIIEAVQAALSAGSAFVESTFAAKDGRRTPFLFSGAHIDIGGRPHVAGMGIDISDRVKSDQELQRHREHLEELVVERTQQLEKTAGDLSIAKEAAEAANRAKSTFLANMSHEIRTPMNAVLGYTQLLLREATLAGNQRKHLETINSSGNHLLSLINDILEMSRIEAGRTTLLLETSDLWSLLEEIIVMFTPLTSSKGLVLGLQLDPHLQRHVIADGSKIRQVVINLLSNAHKFSTAGRIDVCASSTILEEDRHRVSISVKDTGSGIEPDQLDKIFDAFEQTTEGKRHGGTGLGMAISRSFARLMSGDLTVESVKGGGSRFEFTFEVTEGSSTDKARTTGHPLPAHLAEGEQRRRVLIVDDVETNRDLQAAVLSAVGFQICQASSGEEAISQHDSFGPDLVLMDLRMPGMGGTEAIRQLRANGSTTPIIAISASVSTEDRQEAVDAGADGFLAKPHTDTDLLAKIGEVAGIEYEYQEAPDELSVMGDTARDDALELLPGEVIQSLREATIAGRIERMITLLDQLAEQSPNLAKQLRGMVDRFDYEAVLKQLEQPLSRM